MDSMNDPRSDWNARWRERVGEPLEADSWLVRVRPLLPPGGRALDLACGRGRNALWLAAEGFAVTAVDIAEEGLRQLREEAARQGLPVTTCQCDLEARPRLAVAAYDLVLCCFYLQRSLLGALRASVKPGGVALVRTFSEAGDFPGGVDSPAFVLKRGELLEIFAGWEILLHEEGLEPSRKGGGLAGIVARRPIAE